MKSEATGALFLLMMLLPVELSGQTDQNPETDDSFPKFAFSTKLGFSLSGPTYTSEFKMFDELGLEIDVMSLLKNEQIREQMNVSPDQLKRMKAIKAEIDKDLGEIIALISSENQREEIKDKILGAEAVLLNILEPEQAELLNQLKNQLGISRYGLVPYLSQNSMLEELGLNETEKTIFLKRSQKVAGEHEQRTRELNEELNRRLMESLPKTTQSQIEKLFTSDSYQEFLQQTLFGKRGQKQLPSVLKQLQSNTVKITELIKNPSVRQKLALDPTQEKEIKVALKNYHAAIADRNEQLNEHGSKTRAEKARLLAEELKRQEELLETKFAEILLDWQNDELFRIWVLSESQKMGSVGTLALGVIDRKIRMSDSLQNRLFQTGLDLERERIKQSKQLEKEYRLKVMDLMGARHARNANRLIGRPTDSQWK